MKKSIVRSLVAMTLLCSAADALALPAPHKPNPLAKYGVEIPASIGEVWADGTDPSIVYVGPKDRQSVVGRFASTNPTLDCSDLNRIRSVTWRFPLPSEVQSTIASGQAYSPAFDALFAVAARNINVLE